MSDHERGAYAPPTDAPLSFDPRQPVRGSRPIPFTLIISILVLLGLAAAIFVFYRSGVRHAGQPPQTVGAPVTGMKAPPPAEAQPLDPAAGLQVYKPDGDKSSTAPQFTPAPEAPQARTPAPSTPIQVIPAPPAAPAVAVPALRPSISAQPPASAQPLASTMPTPAAKAEPPKALPSASRAETPAPKAAPLPKTPTKTAPAKPEKVAAPAPAAKATGVAAVQIGAFSSKALADKGWSDATAVAPGAAAGKGKNVEKVDKDGKTLFRTQVTGFASHADAAAFCNKLKAAGKACFVK